MKKTGCRSALTTAFLFLVCVVLALGVVWQRGKHFADAPIQGLAPDASLVVARGDSFKTVLGKIRAVGIESGHDVEWQALAKLTGAAGRIQIGEYALPEGITPRRLLIDMRDGKVVSYRFTLVEGWNIRDLRRALARASNLKQETAGMSNEALMKALGHPDQHPDCLLYTSRCV